MTQQKWCCECGLRYNYNSDNPLGATSSLCPSCQKSTSRKKKKFALYLIAGNGEIKCRACGFMKYPYAIRMIPAIENRIAKVTPEKDAEQSYLLCCNCDEARKVNDLAVRIINVNSYPMELSIFETNVSVVETEITKPIPSSDAIDLEVVHGAPEETIRRVSPAIRRLEDSGS